MQLSLEGFNPDHKELLSRLEMWPQSFSTICYQTRWQSERVRRAVLDLLSAEKIVKDCDGTYRPFHPAWDKRG